MNVSNNNVISVIVPVYNIGPYIKRCVESLLSQTYSPMELILVDDGSSDSSGSILDELAAQNENIQVIHIPNGGVTNARLTGIRLAAGDYIGFCDGDDTVEPDMYRHLLENAKAYGADISHCGYQMIINGNTKYFYNTGLLAEQDNATALAELLRGSKIEPALCNKLFHRSLFHSLLRNDMSALLTVRNNEDLLMNYYLFRQAHKSVYEDFCPYHYIVRPNSAVTGKLSEHKLYDPIRVQKILLQETAEQPELQRIVYGRLAAMYSRGAEMESGEQPELIEPFRKMCRRELWKILPTVLFRTDGIATKIHALLASFCPQLCRLIHKVYSKKRGTYNTYAIN